MATEININGTLTLDQTFGLQDDDVAISNTLTGLSQAFIDFLNSLAGTLALSNDQKNFADDVEAVVSGANFVTVTQNDVAINDLFFSDADGNALDGDQVFLSDGVTPLQTVDGDNIYLWSFAGGDIVLATTSATEGAGKVVVAFYLNEAGDHLSASIEYVSFIPLAHPDDTDPDDTVDFTDILNITATGSLSFDFDELASGNFLHVTVGTEDAGLLISGLEPVIKADGSINKQASETVNTSQGGEGATVGIDNQMFVPGNVGVFSFVKGQIPGTYTDIDDLDYDDFLDVKDGTVFISQVQGNKNTNFTLKISAFSAGGADTDPEEGRSYIDNDLGSGNDLGLDPGDSALKDDDPVEILRVVIKNGAVLVTDTTVSNAFVTFNADGSITAQGLNAGYTVQWFTDDPATAGFETYNRFYLEAIEGKFDIGRIDTSEGITVTEPVGDSLFVDDDGPTANITDTGVDVVHDETAGVQDGTEAADVGDPTSDPGTDDDQPLAALPAAFPAGAIGWALSPGVVVNSSTSSFGTDGAGSTTWSITVPAANTDSGFVDLNGDKILLNVEGDLVVGRVDDDGDNMVDNTDQIAIAILLDASQKLAVAQYIPLGHFPDTGPDQVATMLDSALLAKLIVTDADGDMSMITEPIGDKVKIEDDGPAASNPDLGFVEEEHNVAGGELDHGNEDITDGPPDTGADEDTLGPDDFDQTTNVKATNLGALVVVQPGVDAPAKFKLLDDTSGLPALTSKGEAVKYDVSVDEMGNTDPSDDVYTLTAFVDVTGGTADSFDDGTDRVVFTWVVTAAGLATFTLMDQLDNPAPAAGTAVEDILAVNLTSILEVRDADNDLVTLGNDFAEYNVIDDVPIFTADIDGTGFVEFVDGDTFTSSLNGSVGTDENDANDEASDGTKTYTFTDANIVQTTIAGLKYEIIEDGTRVVFFTDGDSAGNVADVFDGNDILWFDNTLDQTANAGAGSYTFEVHQTAPSEFLEFDFDGFPSGKQAYGVFGAGTNGTPDPDGPAILVFAQGTNLVNSGPAAKVGTPVVGASAGNLVNSSNAENSGTALAVNNQSTSPGQAMFIAYIADPEADNIVVGVGTSNELNGFYDDAEFLHFNQGLTEVTSASVELSQTTPNGSLVDVEITAYNVTLVTAINTEAEAIDFLENPLQTTANQSAAQVNIDAVRVRDASGEVIEFWQDYDHDGTYELADFDGDTIVENDATVNVVFTGAGGIFKATVLNAADNYTIEWDTQTVHDLALVKNVDTTNDNFDIGGFNLAQGQDTPDQKFDFTVAITDYDGDTEESNTFEVFVDGTGNFNNDTFDLIV
jgi:hypothetical protein